MADKNTDRVSQEVENLIEPLTSSLGLELVQVVYRRETEGWVLRILVDRQNGSVNIDDCRQLSHELSDLLDVEDPIPTAYRLEVSSPGLDRPLVKLSDFDRFSGQQVKLKTKRMVHDRKSFSCTLVGVSEQQVVLEVNGERIEIDHASIAAANLVPQIEGFPSRRGD